MEESGKRQKLIPSFPIDTFAGWNSCEEWNTKGKGVPRSMLFHHCQARVARNRIEHREREENGRDVSQSSDKIGFEKNSMQRVLVDEPGE